MNITILESQKPLRKQLSSIHALVEAQLADQAYPHAASFITHTHEVGDIQDYFEVVVDSAKRGFCLLKGSAKHELTEFASRRDLVDRAAKTELLILDIDGLPYQFETMQKMTDRDVFRAADWVIQQLPPVFHKASYVAVASSNFGRKPGLRMHLHFLLSIPTEPDFLRKLIQQLNFECSFVSEHLSLTPTGRQIKYMIDPCLADNSRLVFVAPPLFQVPTENPFSDDSHRIVLVQRIEDRLDIQGLKDALLDYPLERVKKERLKELCKKAGIEYVQPKLKDHFHAGQHVQVIQNPEFVAMEIAAQSDKFVRYNVNGGDSNAYWVWMSDPEVVYSFKPDEPPFLFKKANPQVYEQHCQKFRDAIQKASAIENAEGHKIVPMVVLDRAADACYTLEYDPFADVVRSVHINSKFTAENWLRDLGMAMPNPIPAYQVVFDPTSPYGHDAERRILNTFHRSKLMTDVSPFEGEPLQFGEASDWMEVHTPLCATIIGNMVGDDALCFEHFINWFAFLIQRREKPETAWVVHGVEGTGKGIFIKRIAKPILGSDYVVEQKLTDMVNDKFNAYLETALLLFIDEFNMNGKGTNVWQTVSMLKQQITQSTLNIRGMHRNPEQKKTHFGMIFATNDIDALRLSPTDRRYNVCPRQENPLVKRIPDINLNRERYDEQIAAELPKLTSMLMSFKYDSHRVRTPLSNEAKATAAEAGMMDDELFFNAVRQGDLEFFLPILNTKCLSPKQDPITLGHLKSSVTEWARDRLLDEPSKIEKPVLKALYTLVVGHINDIAFGRKCKQFGLTEAHFRTGNIRQRGYVVSWTSPDLQGVRELLETSREEVMPA